MTDHLVPAGLADRLDRVVPSLIPGLSRQAARRLIADGSVFLNGRRCRVASRLARPGDRVRIAVVDPQRDGRGLDVRATEPLRTPQGPVLTVLYEDEELLAIDKPAGMPSAPTGQAAAGTALEVIRAQLRRRDGRPTSLWVVHRLDTGTSGVLLFARDRGTAAALSAAFQRQTVDKTYRAVVTGAPATDAGSIAAPIHAARGRASVSAKGKPARTEWRRLADLAGGTLLEAHPHSGRMHQIRVHLASIGHPVLGDRLYGGAPAPRLMLHAAAIELPWGGERLRIESREAFPPPTTAAR